ncbi:MAG: ATP-binding cassette domain-containing protein [Planctomycetota bacterium]
MIEVERVTKRFGSVVAVDSVSFRIGRGEIVGFLGPNGAGKSTLLKMMCTWMPPTAGRIRIDGHDVVKEPLPVRRSLGYLPEHNALYEGMKVDRFLRFMGEVRGMGGAYLKERLGWVSEKCGLFPVLSKKIQQCSKGFRQRIGLGASLLHDPSVILLDEPTHGLDPLQVVAFREFIEELREGRSILFSSHILAEVNAISDRLLIIHRGRLLADTAVEELRARSLKAGQELEQCVLEIVRSGETVA